jgi:hypothetical protein
MLSQLLSLFLLVSSGPVLDEAECKRISDVPQTRPAAAPVATVIAELKTLKDVKGRLVVPEINEEFQEHLKELFEADPLKISKLEQFYGLLFWIGKYKALPERRIDFDRAGVTKLLLASKVFSDVDVPEAIESVTLFWNKAFDIATYAVQFKTPQLELPLNQGRGFATFREGLCQIAQKLIFYGGFEFNVERRSNGHFYVSQFKDVDLFGVFGSRGVVDVDIQYVSIKSVEFLKGSPMGIVRAKVSRKEFDINSHSVLLRMVTHFVTDKSTQPIDW